MNETFEKIKKYLLRREIIMRIGIIIILLVLAMIFMPVCKSQAIDTSKVQIVSIKKITTEGYYGSPKWSPDGTKLYVTVYDMTQKKGGWAIMNPDGTGKQVRWDDKSPEDYSPDKIRYVYLDADNNLAIANMDGSGAHLLGAIKATEARWSPAGDKIAFLRYRKYYTVSPDGSNLTLIYDFDKHPQKGSAIWGFAVSPDGKSFAIGSSVNLQWKKIDTGKGIMIYTVGKAPIWSPDGKKIYSSTGDIKAFDITNLSISGDISKSGHEAASYFDINFNKGLIAYTLSEDYIDPATGKPDSHIDLNNIWIMDINGSGHRKLTTDKGAFAGKEGVVISPDGRYIAYKNEYDRNIYTIELSYQ
jgi:Tol biopolymer transport system component